MWRLVQGISRSVREHFRGSFRTAPQTVCHEDERETEVLTKQVENLYHHSKIDNVKKVTPNSICKEYTRTHNGEDQQGNKNYFHYNFWYQQCQHCQFIEAVGIGTALILGCQVSQLVKLTVRKERKLCAHDNKHWANHLYEAAFNPTCLSSTNFVLPHDKRNTSTKLEADVSWAKTPPKPEAETKKKDSASKGTNKVYDYLSHIDDIEDVLVPEKLKEINLHTDTDQVSGESSKHKKESDIFEEFNHELADACNKYHHTLYNKEGLRLAQCGKYTDAIKYWEKASRLGSNQAAFNLGLCYETGKGTPVDLNKAVEFYVKAIERGNAMAAYNLGLMYLNDQCSMKIDKSAEELLKEASAQGIPEAQTELGVIYSEQGNMAAAADLFSKAAEQKDSYAQYFLGLCYENGLGVEENACKAVELYSQASKQGHLQARYNLAYFFEHGLGGLPLDKKEALQLYKDCANRGMSIAARSADRLAKQNEKHKDLLKKELDSLQLKVSHSTPSMSSYLRHHIKEFGDIGWEEMVHPRALIKSATMQSFITPSNFDHDQYWFYGNQQNEDVVKFSLGEDRSTDDLDASVNYIMMEGGFGNVSLPKTKDNVMLEQQLHKSQSFGNLSESDDSDFSIVFDSDISGIQLQNFETGIPVYSKLENKGNVYMDKKNRSYDTKTFSEFDVFGSSCSLDELSGNAQSNSLAAVAVN